SLYEVPLMFANPFGVEVLPLPIKLLMDSPSGGRARRSAEQGRPSLLAGEGDQLKELREHVPGDAFKKIAWKASAKRGRHVVRALHLHRACPSPRARASASSVTTSRASASKGRRGSMASARRAPSRSRRHSIACLATKRDRASSTSSRRRRRRARRSPRER